MKKYDVLTAFDLCVDFLIDLGQNNPEFGQKEKLVPDYSLEMGGSACIFACGCSKLGLSATGVGSLGSDSMGDFMRDTLEAQGVDISHIRQHENKTGLTLCLTKQVANETDRAILTCLGAMDVIEPSWIEALLTETRHVHVCSYFLLKSLQKEYPRLLSRAKEMGVTISLDTNWDPEETWDSGIQDILPYVDIFLPNEQELMNITGATNVQTALENLGKTVPIIVVKCGEKGAYAYCQGVTRHSQALQSEVIDTVGAGDSFNAGFIYGYLNQHTIQECVQIGTICGSLNTRFPGGIKGQPNLEKLNEYLQK